MDPEAFRVSGSSITTAVLSMSLVFRNYSFIAIALGLSACANMGGSEGAWTRCAVGGTALVGSTAVMAGMTVISGVTLGMANAGLGCFLVYENIATRTEKRHKAAAEENATKPTVSATQQTIDSSNAAFPVIPLFPSIESDD